MDTHLIYTYSAAALLGIILLWILFGRQPNQWRSQFRFGGFLTAVISFSLVWSISLILCGGLMFIWPGYSERKLMSLSPDQVIARLGLPSNGDPRQRGWREDRDGRLGFSYEWNWAATYITFEHNRAIRVSMKWK